MFKLLTSLKKGEWVLFIFGIALILGGAYLDLVIPTYLSDMLAELQKGQGAVQGEIIRNGLIMVSMAVGSAFSIIACNYVFAIISARFGNRLRELIFNKVNSFGEIEVKKFSTAGLLTRLINDVVQVRTFFSSSVQFLVKAPFMVVGAVIMILDRSPELSIVNAIGVGSLFLVVIILLIFVMPKFKKIQSYTDELNAASRENIIGIKDIRAYNAEEFQERKFNVKNKKLADTFLFVNSGIGIFFPFISFAMCGVGLANWWLGAILGIDFADISIFSQWGFQIILSFMFLVFVMMQLPRAIVSGKRIKAVLYADYAVADGSLKLDKGSKEPAVVFENVNFHVLQNINFSVQQGQRVAIIGATGAGKTTLVSLIERFFDCESGVIKLFGKDIKEYDLKDLRSNIAYVPQTAQLFKTSVRENITLGMQKSDKEIWNALKIAQADDFVKKLEGKLDFQIAQHGDNLSGGQKQRISIARGVLRSPLLYIFDDTFSALDYATDAKLRAALSAETKGATQIIVAQRVGTIRDCDQIIVLDKGHIAAIGKHQYLFKNSPVYKEIALSQLSNEELTDSGGDTATKHKEGTL
ncbi:MAG: ABC transporter ATP-binding protein/permease [Christensenellaceae bacterium]|jgi:ATP-binding cassette subfamily B protein|nr:ABC transporter ATP-binding protein/permease [Christensenellaceae bacterium]